MVVRIYIPLCFYFITRPDIHWKNHINLHSTMLLLYRVHLDHAAPVHWFTFHYASTLSTTGENNWTDTEEFTFHYASTLSDTLSWVWWLFSQFTFHYASTLSYCRYESDGRSGIYIPLCFYFIQRLNIEQPADCLIYIPLCFYFIT